MHISIPKFDVGTTYQGQTSGFRYSDKKMNS